MSESRPADEGGRESAKSKSVKIIYSVRFLRVGEVERRREQCEKRERGNNPRNLPLPV